MTAFKDTNNMDKGEYTDLTEHIHKDNGQEVDIITFYNEEFVAKTKPMLLQIKYQPNSAM